jgi:hypothetical protein
VPSRQNKEAQKKETGKRKIEPFKLHDTHTAVPVEETEKEKEKEKEKENAKHSVANAAKAAHKQQAVTKEKKEKRRIGDGFMGFFSSILGGPKKREGGGGAALRNAGVLTDSGVYFLFCFIFYIYIV